MHRRPAGTDTAHVGSPRALAALYVGAVVGAGFATGQEVLFFFTRHGTGGLWGALLALVLFAWLGWRLYTWVATRGVTDYRQALCLLAGRKGGAVLDILVTGFLWTGLAIVMAGAGALAAEQWGWRYGAGVGMLAAVSAAVTLSGARGVLAANAALVPPLAAGILGLLVSQWWHGGQGGLWTTPPVYAGRLEEAGGGAWLLSSLLYVGYNGLVVLVAACSVGRQLACLRAPGWPGFLGGLGVGGLVLAVHLTLAAGTPVLFDYHVPLGQVASSLGPFLQALYGFTLFAALLTTALATALGLGARLAPPGAPPGPWGAAALMASVPLTGYGFAPLVRFVYTAMGYVSLVVLALFLWRGRAGDGPPPGGGRPGEQHGAMAAGNGEKGAKVAP